MRPIAGPFAFRPSESANPHLWNGHKVGFAPCVSGAGRNVADLSPSRFDFLFTGTASAFSVEQSPIGPACKFAGNARLEQQDASWGLPCKFLVPADDNVGVILQTVFRFPHSGSAKESTIFWSDAATVGSLFYGYKLLINNNTDKLRLTLWDAYNGVSSGAQTHYTSSVTLTPDKWYHAVVLWFPMIANFYGSGACRMWFNGEMDNAIAVGPGNYPVSTGENYGGHLAAQHATVGASVGFAAPDVSVAMVNVWNSQWIGFHDGSFDPLVTVVNYIHQLNADPLAMYRRRKRGSGAKGSRLVTIGGTALRRLNVAVAG